MGLLALFAMAGTSHIAGQSTSDDERAKSVQGIKQVLMNEGLVEEGNEIRAGLIINPACGVCNELVSDHFDVVHFVVVADGRYRPPSGNIRFVNWSCSGGQVAFPTLVITSGESVELIAKKQVIEAVLTRNSQLYARKG